jgi:hypothetical protein
MVSARFDRRGAGGDAPAVNRVPGPTLRADRRATTTRWLIALALAALASRLLWVLVIHPPGDYVFSDMGKYVDRARDVAITGWAPAPLEQLSRREWAWQAFGTHAILSIPLRIFGSDALFVAGVLWGLMAAAAVPLAYLLAVRTSAIRHVPEVVGLAMLVWHPNMSNAGYFLSETPFLCFALASTLGLVVLLQDGGWKPALLAGLAGAVAFVVRPQSALFFALAFLTWLIVRRRVPHVRVVHIAIVCVPLLVMLSYSIWRFHAHTGYAPGIAENANMNLTAGRCHNVVTQAFKTESDLARSDRKDNTRDGRRVSLPNYRIAWHLPDGHPLAVRPVMEHESIKFVGYVGDPEIHEEIRRECYARTGVLGQVRITFVNLMLSWFVDHQWPEVEKGRATFLPILEGYKHAYQICILVPSLVGMWIAIARIRQRPAFAIVAWQQVNYLFVAALFFGTIRLRTPYDPYSIILAAEAWGMLLGWWLARRVKKRAAGP